MVIADKQVLLWGGGSQARIIASMIEESASGTISGIFDNLSQDSFFSSQPIFINSLQSLAARFANFSHFVVCIGNDNGLARTKISVELCNLGLNPISIIHSTAWLDETSRYGKGCQIMPRATIHKFVEIGDWVIINTAATIDHECIIGAGAHIMGGAALAGRIKVGDRATIGTNATILPDISIGEGAYVGAGAVVTRDVAPNELVCGVPARFVRISDQSDPENTLKKLRLVIGTAAKD